MKKLFLILFLGIGLVASANTIHWITFIDTTDPRVGELDINGRKFLYSQWINKVSAALASEGYSNRIYDYYGTNTSPLKCKQVIQNLRCEKNDIVVFYYIGHGGRAIADQTKYPQMLLAQQDDKKCIPLTWVHNTLKETNARLVITIGMCCNSYDPFMTPKETIAFSPNQGAATYAIGEMESIQKFFLENVGDIIVSSSAAGQSSVGFFIPGMEAPMDVFTYRFIMTFNNYIKETSKPSWHTLLGRVTTDVNNITLMHSRVAQTPQYDINVQFANRPTKIKNRQDTIPPKPVVTPKPNDEPESCADETSQAITTVLDNLINVGEGIPTRMRRANLLKAHFTSDAVVKTIAEDSKNVVDKMLISDFLDIVATSPNYYKIIVLSVKQNDEGQYTEMRVREYIKK